MSTDTDLCVMGLLPADVRRLGLRPSTVQMMAEYSEGFEFDAPPDVVAEFFLYIDDLGVDIDSPAAIAWWEQRDWQVTR